MFDPHSICKFMGTTYDLGADMKVWLTYMLLKYKKKEEEEERISVRVCEINFEVID